MIKNKADQSHVMNKTLPMAIMLRPKLRNTFRINRTEEISITLLNQ